MKLAAHSAVLMAETELNQVPPRGLVRASQELSR
ncbi:hypothetical protein HNR11_001390 [Nesterenkonia sandarakina]|uniref:Uncharacterized protein n=1 Tax=Nesterenkonia sandarakina TaxID=272918 RepID=A0A7Z0E867_9MICC|nr:hypothetical protein [Nesterenkonia sandarakina]